MEKTARFIWSSEALPPADRRIAFRKTALLPEGPGSFDIEIWADSRYFLWVGGRFIGTGPARCWPAYPEKDVWRIDASEAGGSVSIAVLIWHYGTSTSQYVHGPAGFFLRAAGSDLGGGPLCVSDESWKSAAVTAYDSPVPRVNVSQAWLEIFDEQIGFGGRWTEPGFDDGGWAFAAPVEAGRDADGQPLSLENMAPRSVPLLRSEFLDPVEIIQSRRFSARGTGVRIDYKDAFYPGDRTTEDRLQFGYICGIIESQCDQTAVFTLADRCWPAVDEFIVINGRRLTVAADRSSIELELLAGENLLLIDISGAKQRFSLDFHLLPESPVSFKAVSDDSPAVFSAAGPFKTAVIGNIVCADGFDFKSGGTGYDEFGRCSGRSDLRSFAGYLKPVSNVHIDGVKLRRTGVAESPEPLLKPAEGGALFPAVLLQTAEAGDHEIIFDMGVEVSGFVEFTIEAGSRSELDFTFFEYMRKDGPELPEDLDTSMRYSCPPGLHSYRSLYRRGFRYLAVRLRSDSDLILKSLRIDEQLYPMGSRGDFRCSDGRLTDIWKMCRRTVALCSEDAPADSPAFEQAFWVGDAYVMALYQQYLSGDSRLIRRSLMLAARSMHYSPLPDCHLPAGVHLILTAWSQFWVLAVYDYYVHTADTGFIAEIFPWVEKAAEFFLSMIGDDGLFRFDAWNLLDWAGMDTPYRGTIAHINARLVACFERTADLAEIAGSFDRDPSVWRSAAAVLSLCTDRAFWSEEAGCYIDCIHDGGGRSEIVSVQTNLMMHLYGCIPDERLEAVEGFILDPPEYAVRPGSPFMAHFYYEFLFEKGLGERALEGIKEQWSPMLAHGTCWETFIGFYKERLTRSYCHAWSSAPVYLFGAYVLGLRPAEPAFKSIVIAPRTCGLKKASGRVPMPAGDAQLSWRVADGCFAINAVLPEGTEWRFIPPGGYEGKSEIEVEFRKGGAES